MALTLVTGASGFVGSAVVRRLLDAGHQVRALVRPHSDRRNLTGLQRVELVTGDLTDRASLTRVVQNCDYLFHVAADYRLWIPDPATIYRTNVDGSRNIIQCATEAGVKKIVYTSSVATLGLNADHSPAAEETPVSLADMTGHYKRSKYLAEKAVRELIRVEGAPVVIVNPSAPVGPRDIKPTPTGRIFIDVLRRRIPAYVDTGLNIVHVDDVARGHLLALEHGLIGERYILGGDNMTLQAVLEEASAVAGVAPPSIKLPHNALFPAAWLAEGWARLTGREPFVTMDEIRMAKKYMFFSSDKARQHLDYKPRPAVEGIRDAMEWFMAQYGDSEEFHTVSTH